MMFARSASEALLQSFPMMGGAGAQVWSYAPKFRRPRHFHAEPEINIVVHGSASFGVGHTRVDVHAGEVLGFLPGQDHVLQFASPDLVLLAAGAKARVLGAEPNLGGMPSPLHLRPRSSDFACLVARAEAIAGSDDEARAAELWDAVRGIARRSDPNRPRSPHVFTQRALGVLGRDRDIDRTGLAKHVRGHATDLSRYFHRDVGVTLVRFRTRLRLFAFISEVDRRGENLVAAALHAGFGSYSQCHRAFVTELGCAPSKFFSGGLRDVMEHRFEPDASVLATPPQ